MIRCPVKQQVWFRSENMGAPLPAAGRPALVFPRRRKEFPGRAFFQYSPARSRKQGGAFA
ncbi:hypothetical protein CE91St46_34660 [Eubacteriales bacterium]|nr:hypothetical protein CE91St46_34660 [Eubacteriales bacterium]GKH65075.1 hypothetical protein CE91St47_35440 [Eubacteriales bacterium]